MLTATAKACGQGGGSISCPPNANEGVFQTVKPREALEDLPVLFLHCINNAMVTPRCQRNTPRSKMLIGQSETRAKTPDTPSTTIFHETLLILQRINSYNYHNV